METKRHKHWTESPKVESRWLALCELHKQKLSPGLTALYMNILQSVPEEIAAQTLENLLYSSHWFPKLSDIHEALSGNQEEQAVHAWNILIQTVRKIGPYQSVYFQDPKIGMLVEYFNGWLAVCQWTEKEIPFIRKEFIQTYKTIRIATTPKVHPGIIEIENNRTGHTTNIPNPIMITQDGQSYPLPRITMQLTEPTEETRCLDTSAA